MKSLFTALIFALAVPSVSSAQVGLELAGAIGDWNVIYGNIDHPMVEGWQRNFVPTTKGISASPHHFFLRVNILELGMAPTVVINYDTLLRFPVTYTPFHGLGLGREHVHENVVHWWDPVVGNAVDMRQALPTFGIQYLSNGGGIGYSITRYRFTKQEYEGVDCWGCQNGSRVISSEPYGASWGHRISLVVYRASDNGKSKRGRDGAEVYYEYLGKGAHRLGVKAIYGFKLF